MTKTTPKLSVVRARALESLGAHRPHSAEWTRTAGTKHHSRATLRALEKDGHIETRPDAEYPQALVLVRVTVAGRDAFAAYLGEASRITR